MGAIWVRARSELRSRWAAAVALALMIGVAAGVVITAAAGARRTDTAYERFLAWSHPPDAGISLGDAFGFVGLSRDRIVSLPEVASSSTSDQVSFVSSTESGRYLFIGQGSGSAPRTARGLHFQGRFKVLEGRMFDPRSEHEVVVGWGTGH